MILTSRGIEGNSFCKDFTFSITICACVFAGDDEVLGRDSAILPSELILRIRFEAGAIGDESGLLGSVWSGENLRFLARIAGNVNKPTIKS